MSGTPPLPPPLPDAAPLAALIRSRALSAREATAAALARIEALDGGLHAFCTLAPDAALATAGAVDAALARGEDPGPLAGVPVAVKDLIATEGLRTTFGSPLYAGFVPEEDDVCVRRLRAAGAVVIGKTNASEFGYGPVGHNPLFPATRNPWDPALTPGGSSAGSAVAVATGMTPVALGSDGGGSIRIPGALTGVVGIKPSWGRVPLWPGCRDERWPGASGWEALEHIGPLTRTVADAALTLSVIAGPDPMDRHSLPAEGLDWADLSPLPLRGARLAYAAEMGAAADPEVAALCEAAARDLAAALGASLTPAAPDTGPVQPVFEAIVAMETDRAGLSAMARAAGRRFAGPLATVLETDWTADAFTAALIGRKRIVNATARFMAGFELLLSPAAGAPAFPVGRQGPERIGGRPAAPSDWTAFSALANLTGLPAATVPAGLTAAGLPVGLQIMGRRLDDLAVLRAAAALETARPWAHLRPPEPAPAPRPTEAART